MLWFKPRQFCQNCVWKQLEHSYGITSENMVTPGEENEERVVGSSERIGSDNPVEQMRGSQSSRFGHRPGDVKIYCEALWKILHSTCFNDLGS